jgi:hypothetical protein
MPGIDAYTVLCLHCDGVDASTSFPDSALAPHAVTAVGNAQVDTAQSKFGGASALFDGTGDYLTLDGSADFAFGTGDFTIDFWMCHTGTYNAYEILYDSRPFATQGLYPTIYLASGQLRYLIASVDYITGSSPSTDVWHHIALTRSGTSTRLFVDGIQVGSTLSDSTNYINGASRPMIAASGPNNADSFKGWLDEVRVSKGIARWTTTFTPPTAPYDAPSTSAIKTINGLDKASVKTVDGLAIASVKTWGGLA